MRSTFRPLWARHADKLIAVVVYSHPPFWLAIELILIIPFFYPKYHLSYQKMLYIMTPRSSFNLHSFDDLEENHRCGS